MAKLTTCKTCGGQVATSAQVCPHCGARQWHGTKIAAKVALCAVLLLAAVIIITIIQSGRARPKKVSAPASAPASTAAAAPAEKPTPTPTPVYSIGDTLEIRDVQTTLIDVRTVTGGQFSSPSAGNIFLIFEVEICNNSKEEVAVSSLLSFAFYVDDYAQQFSLEAILADGGRQLDGTVSPGKKSRGIMAVEAPKDWQTAELRFTPDVWSGGTFVFDVTRDQAS